MYQHDKACRQFVSSMAAVDVENMASQVSEARFICILSDGSTDSSQTEQEAVFIRFVDRDGEAKTVLCDIVAVEDAHAVGVKSAIDKGLQKLSIDEATLQKKLVACNFDGAAVMMGCKNGVATKYRDQCPWIITVHCVAHNLESSCCVGHNERTKMC